MIYNIIILIVISQMGCTNTIRKNTVYSTHLSHHTSQMPDSSLQSVGNETV